MKRHPYTAQLVHEFGKSLLCCLVWCWSGGQSEEKGGISLAWKELVMEPCQVGNVEGGKLQREEGKRGGRGCTRAQDLYSGRFLRVVGDKSAVYINKKH